MFKMKEGDQKTSSEANAASQRRKEDDKILVVGRTNYVL